MPLGILKCIGQLPAKKNYWASDTQTWRLRSPGCRARPGLSSRNLSLHGPALSRAQLEAFISPDIETQKCKMISLDVPYLFPLALSFVLMQLYFNLGDFERKAGFKACPEQWKVCEQRPWPPLLSDSLQWELALHVGHDLASSPQSSPLLIVSGLECQWPFITITGSAVFCPPTQPEWESRRQTGWHSEEQPQASTHVYYQPHL